MHSLRVEARRGPATATRRHLAVIALLAALAAPTSARPLSSDEAVAPAPAASDASDAVDQAAPAAPVPASAASAQAVAIVDAVAQLKVDPLMAGKHKTRALHWNSDDEPEKKKERKPESDFAWLHWVGDLVDFINDTSRILLYGLIAVLVAVLLVSLRHLVQLRSFRRRTSVVTAVSHVRDLDVRPESLPDDIGAAAWALWRGGQVPAALSLLYRGALSRLIHRWAVPISSATTEGECLELARSHLDATALRYLTQLVRAWEANIYGSRALSDAMGETLCSGFATRLDASASAVSTKEAVA